MPSSQAKIDQDRKDRLNALASIIGDAADKTGDSIQNPEKLAYWIIQGFRSYGYVLTKHPPPKAKRIYPNFAPAIEPIEQAFSEDR